MIEETARAAAQNLTAADWLIFGVVCAVVALAWIVDRKGGRREW